MLKNHHNQRYLRFTHEDTAQHGFLQFTGETVISPHVKFEVQHSTSAVGLVHLRCGYNNKYLVRSSDTQLWIAAAADSAEEDRSKWSCTLFRPVSDGAVDNPQGGRNPLIRFLHVQLNQYVTLFQLPPFNNFAIASSSQPGGWRDTCEVVDWGSIVVMPRHLVFKGDNGMYLRALVIERFNYHEFSATSSREATAGNEVFPNPDGSIRIWSNHYRRFWRRSPNWIWGDSTDTTSNNRDTVFWPVRVNRNVVALRCAGNNRFCKRLTAERKISCLNASDVTISEFAMLEVEERVSQRTISNVVFRLNDARVYDETPRTVFRNIIVNNSPHTNSPTLTVTYANTQSKSWQSSLSFSFGVTTSVSGGFPKIAEAGIEISVETTEEYTWGETYESSAEVSQAYPVTVGPFSRATITVMVTQGSCDVPFSYTRKDDLFDGTSVTTRLDDGLYTGVNVYNFRGENVEESLTAEEMIRLAQEEEEKKKMEKGEADGEQ
ncbi:unnamed protein product [Linum trigynum]|uniref:Agglutinin domain-containing protein n=1 Tax=Linum trigynum TaxID=586398 RepID=A0AAV2GHQ6_9ROSI